MEIMHSRMVRIGVVILVTLIPLLIWQCDRHETLIGTYRAIDAGSEGQLSATLVLQANGKGLWSIDTDNAPFRWNLRQNAIHLHTQAGGVIQGTIDGETIRIDMPGTGMIAFKRQR